MASRIKESAVVIRVRAEQAHGLRNRARCLTCASAIASISDFSSDGEVVGDVDCGDLVGVSSRAVSLLLFRPRPAGIATLRPSSALFSP